MTDPPAAPAWWTAELADLKQALRRYLARQARSLGPSHDDIVGDVLLQLVRTSQSASWLQGRGALDRDARASLHRLACRIARWRLIDARRRQIPTLGLEAGRSAGDVPADRHAQLVALLRVTLRYLEELPTEKRSSVLAELEPTDSGTSRSAAARQRLSRVRRELKQRVEAELGRSVADLLED